MGTSQDLDAVQKEIEAVLVEFEKEFSAIEEEEKKSDVPNND